MEKIALIMAAGEGTRMKSATPKTLHEICGVPMLEHVMRAIEPVCKEQAVIVGYGKEKVIAAYKGRVQFVEQKGDGWGTGFAIKCAAPLLEGRHGVALISAAGASCASAHAAGMSTFTAAFTPTSTALSFRSTIFCPAFLK